MKEGLRGNHPSKPISGTIRSLSRVYDLKFDGKGSKQPSTYSEEVYGYGWSSTNQHPSTQRSNGFVEGSGKPVASGILLGGLDWVADASGGYTAKNGDGCTYRVSTGIAGVVSVFRGPGNVGGDVMTHPGYTFEQVMKQGVWVLTGLSLEGAWAKG